MFDLWVDQSIGMSRASFKNQVKCKLFELQWKDALVSFEASNKAMIFKHLVINKKPNEPTWYIANVTDPHIYRNIAAIRLRNHRLKVEVGSWDNIIFANRLCPECQKLEDEFHMLFECTNYHALRVKFIDTYFTTNPSMQKTIELLNSTDIRTINRLGIFLSKAFKIVYQRDCVNGAPGPNLDE